ncbi:hypothetical protein QS257_12875 [Terrilactibacillus sp. S3-3]|nr:hypothetical protein QS257_12875 [Terrilactibacillus sp. S3-3]
MKKVIKTCIAYPCLALVLLTGLRRKRREQRTKAAARSIQDATCPKQSKDLYNG